MPRFAREHLIFGTVGTAKLISPEIRRVCYYGREPSHDISSIDGMLNGSAIERVSALCLKGYTQNQLLRDIDAVSMSHSLEVRVPFIDPKIVDIALSLPDHTKLGDTFALSDANATYRESGTKKILVDVGRSILPDDIDSQKKSGFGMPFDSWLKGPLRDVLDDTLSSSSVRSRGYFTTKEVERVKNAFLRDGLSWVFPWLLMMTELWCREVLDVS